MRIKGIRVCARAAASGVASSARPPNLKSVPLISRLAPWLLHTSNTVFSNVDPPSGFWPLLLVIGPPAAKSWQPPWCARSIAFAQWLRFALHSIFCPFSAWTPRFRESSCESLAHGPLSLFRLSRHRKAISAAANQKPFANEDLFTRISVKRTIKWWEPNALLRLGNLKCQAVLVGS